MAALIVEYRVADYKAWKLIFDRDPMDRRAQGTTGHVIYRDPRDVGHLLLRMDFPKSAAARRFLELPAFRQVWDMSGATQAWVVEETEAVTY